MPRPPEPYAHRPRKTSAAIMADPGDDDNPHPSFHAASPASSSAFKTLLGPNPKISLCAENPSYPFAHEAGVYIPSTGDLFVTSNHFVPPGARSKARDAGKSPHAAKTIRITKVCTRATPYKLEEVDADVPMANGGVNYGDSVLFCAQGTLDRPGGLVVMERVPPYRTKNILSGFFERSFNSVNDVVVADDGAIWFTDPCYGFEQGIRPSPQLPNQVYRFDPESRDCRVVADGFDRPNGLCFDPDEEILYVTDTGYIHVKDDKPDLDLRRPSTIYAFDISTHHSQPFLTNRRVFAMCDAGVPDGIKCDTAGNVYSGCGDGIHVWSPGGMLLGRILIPGGVANFCFGDAGVIFALNEHRLWRVEVGKGVRGALLDG